MRYFGWLILLVKCFPFSFSVCFVSHLILGLLIYCWLIRVSLFIELGACEIWGQDGGETLALL